MFVLGFGFKGRGVGLSLRLQRGGSQSQAETTATKRPLAHLHFLDLLVSGMEGEMAIWRSSRHEPPEVGGRFVVRLHRGGRGFVVRRKAPACAMSREVPKIPNLDFPNPESPRAKSQQHSDLNSPGARSAAAYSSELPTDRQHRP